jgi:CelD/BcsL family acetyltransferase involved in cellulose biosynthesis
MQATDSTQTFVPAATTMNGALAAEIVRTDGRLGELRDEWTRLFHQSGCTNAFLSFPWMWQWRVHLGSRHELFVVAVRNHIGQLVAVAPWYVRKQAGPLRIRRLGFLGDYLVGSDYLDVIVHPNYAPGSVRCIARILLAHKQEWDYIDLADTTADSNVSTILSATLDGDALRSKKEASSVCPFVVLPTTPEEYQARLGPKIRKHLNYYLRSLEKLGAVEFLTVTRGSEIENAFDELLRLHRSRFKVRERKSAFVDERVVPFHRAAIRDLSEAGHACIHVLKVNGHSVAAVYLLSTAGQTFFYQSGMEPEYARYSVGSLLIRHAIQVAIGEKKSIFDFLRGDEAYKSQWINDTRRMQRLQFFDRRVGSRVTCAAYSARATLRRVKTAAIKAMSGTTKKREQDESEASRPVPKPKVTLRNFFP